MAFNFDDETKEVKEFTESIPFGVSTVQLVLAETGATEAGKEFIELRVTTPDGLEDTARVWFVGGAANISFNTLRQIAVHQGKTPDEKAEIQAAVDSVQDSDNLCEVLNQHIGGELWFTKYYDPSRTYEAQDDSTRRSVNKNIYGYEPKLKPELMPKPQNGDPAKNELNKTFPGNEDISKNAGGTVPDKWS